jgi:hypothetical protein
MSRPRVKVSGCMRSVKGAGTFCAIRSYLATAARHGINSLDALTSAAAGTPLDPPNRIKHPGRKAPGSRSQNGGLSSYRGS